MNSRHSRARGRSARLSDQSGRRKNLQRKNQKETQGIADEYEKPSRIKRSLWRFQTVPDRLHQRLSAGHPAFSSFFGCSGPEGFEFIRRWTRPENRSKSSGAEKQFTNQSK